MVRAHAIVDARVLHDGKAVVRVLRAFGTRAGMDDLELEAVSGRVRPPGLCLADGAGAR